MTASAGTVAGAAGWRQPRPSGVSPVMLVIAERGRSVNNSSEAVTDAPN